MPGELPAALLLFAALAVLVFAYRRLQALLEEIGELRGLVQDLTRRVWELEGGRAAPEPPAAESPALSSAVNQKRSESVSSEDWETVVGANWLNRLGAVVLVIGIALFLGYSLTQLGPAGKIAIGLAAGVSILIAGVAIETQPGYGNLSYSMMGAGWAVVYFTAYASHGVPAARIISNPLLAIAVLSLVSAGMILHALRYRSETATALAYLLGFIGLNFSPLTAYSVVATLGLALSLIGLAYRFEWFRLPLLGVLLTYLTFVLRYEGWVSAVNVQGTLWIYWGAFEIFDLMELRRRGAGRALERTPFLLNAAGFIGASLLHRWHMQTSDWAIFLGISSLGYAASAVLRARWTGRFAEERRPFSSGFDVAASLSATLMAAALMERFDGLNTTIALLMEGEMILLAGIALQSRFLRALGAAVLALPLIRVLTIDISLPVRSWTPTAMLIAAVFAMNRKLVPGAWYFAAAAAGLTAAILGRELPDRWVAPVWAAAAAGLLLVPRLDIRWIAVPGLLMAFLRAAIFNVGNEDVVTTAMVVGAVYAGQLLWRGSPEWVRSVLSVAGTLLLTLLIFEKVQGRLLTVAFGIEGAVLLTAGFLLGERVFRLSGLVLFLVCIGKLFVYDLRELDTGSRILSFVVLGAMLMAASWLYARFRDKVRRLL